MSFKQLNMFMLLVMLVDVKAQSPSSQYQLPSQDVATSIQPSLAVVIGVLLSILVFLTFILLCCAKFCSWGSSFPNQQILQGLVRAEPRFSGIDKRVIESLPFFKFSALKGSKEGLECAVCLSKFEEVEILRLLPKCKHAFHIDCIDQWLENHSSCPLCRYMVSSEDVSLSPYSSGLMFLSNQSGLEEEDSNLEIFIQREEDHKGSSRLSFGGSFRKFHMGKKEEILIQNQKDLHKHKHKIIVSEVVLKNRWSSVSSSDLVFLNSEMLNSMSSNRFSSPTSIRVTEDDKITSIEQEMELKREFDSTFSKILTASEPEANSSNLSEVLNPNEKRSMSEITVRPRFAELNMKNRSRDNTSGNNVGNERMMRLWLPIARRTVEWFANRENSTSQSLYTKQTLNV